MCSSQTSQPASDADLAPTLSVPDDTPGLIVGDDGMEFGEGGLEGGADSGGHTLLSRPPAPQGRRSLFRR